MEKEEKKEEKSKTRSKNIQAISVEGQMLNSTKANKERKGNAEIETVSISDILKNFNIKGERQMQRLPKKDRRSNKFGLF